MTGKRAQANVMVRTILIVTLILGMSVVQMIVAYWID